MDRHFTGIDPWLNNFSEASDFNTIDASNIDFLVDYDSWMNAAAKFELELQKYPDNVGELLRSKHILYVNDVEFSSDTTDFGNRTFPFSIVFRNCNFRNANVNFSNSKFRGRNTWFHRCAFVGGGVNFYRSKFSSLGPSFQHVELNRCELSFVDAELSKKFVFGWVAARDSSINLTRCQIGLGVGLISLRVFERSEIIFVDAHADDGYILICGATDQGISPEKTELANLSSSLIDFSGFEMKGSLILKAEVGGASFRRMRVSTSADFSDCTFNSIPDFRNAHFDRAPAVSQMKVPAPEVTRHEVFCKATDPDDVHRLRKLKAMAIAANDHEKDGEFFAYEMMAKRGTEHTTFWQLLANTIYWKVSFYGQSYLRPLAWMGGTFGVFAALYTMIAALPISGWNSLWFGITYSLKNSLPFLGTITRSVPSLEGHTSWFAKQLEEFDGVSLDWLTVLGTGQAILSLFFFFFLLLGLRNRFRLK